MKPIEAHDQVSLGPARGLQLALTGMSYRMFRSGVTVSILALAVAFLVHMVTHGILAQQTQDSARRELVKERELGERITRLSTPDAGATIGEQLVYGSKERLSEMKAWSAVSDEQFEQVKKSALELDRLSKGLLGLPLSARAVLLADLSPRELFLRLDDEAAVQEFDANLERLKIPNPGVPRKRLKPLLVKERPALDAFARKVAMGHQAAIASVQKAYPGRTPFDLAVSPPSDFSETLSAAGFSFSRETLPPLQEFAEREERTQTIVKLLLDPEVRAAVSRETRVPPGDVSFDVLLSEITDEHSVGWLLAVLGSAQPGLGLDERQLQSLLEGVRRKKRLLSISGEGDDAEAGLFGLNERSLWLIALSFLVCVVGVANAMLMSVTERFTEIATMKCLGAMDRFVMTMFVFEAIVQGVIGGLVGVVVGVLLALLRGLLEFGTLLSGGFGAPLELTLGVLLSFGVGVGLAAAAAVGPSWIAARLPPMEAMRVE